jgi:hypothetical protein
MVRGKRASSDFKLYVQFGFLAASELAVVG